jgi:dTDP-4-amino-4,6-dideoxygalactose transaminase
MIPITKPFMPRPEEYESYFYPSLHTLRFVEKYECTNSQYIAQRVMCLPMHHDLSEEEMHMIVRILLRVQNN